IVKFQFGKRDRQSRDQARYETLARWQIGKAAVARWRRLAMNARFEVDRVHHPKLGDAERRINRGLTAQVIAEARGCNLDHQLRGWPIQTPMTDDGGVKNEVGLYVGIFVQIEACFAR